MIKNRISASIILALMLGGCAANEDDEVATLDELREQQARLEQIVKQQFEVSNNHLRESDGIFLFGKAFQTKKEQPLPPIFDQLFDVGNLEEEPLEDAIKNINKIFQSYGVIVAFERDAVHYLTEQGGDSEASSDENDSGAADDITSPFLPIQKVDEQAFTPSDSSKYGVMLSMDFSNSSLRQMLDLITASTGLWWDYENGRVTLNYLDEATFQIDVSDSSYSVSSNQSSQSTSDTGSADFSLSSKSEEVLPLAQIEEQLKQYLSVDGSLALNRFDRTVTIKDTPNNIARAKKFIDDFNYRSLIPYNIKADIFEIVYEVNRENQVDWALAFENAGLSFNLGSPTISTDSNLGGLTGGKVGGKFDGSKAMIKFLDANSSVYSRITNTVKTKNNIPTQLVSSQNKAIIAGREVTIDSNGFSQESTTTKLINEGFNLSSRPRITSDGRIDMELILNTKTINDINSFGSEDNLVQLEETGQHGTITGIPIRSGETVVLNAYERDLSSAQLTSLNKQMPWWSGGSKTNKRYKAALIVMVRADIMEH